MTETVTKTVVSKDVNSEYALEINRWILSALGIWQFAVNLSYYSRIKAFCHIITCALLILFIVIPILLYIFISVKDLGTRLRVCGCFSFCVMGMIKYIYLLHNNKEIGVCIKLFVADWNRINDTRGKEIMINYARFGRTSSLICNLFMYGSCLVYALILPQVSGAFANQNDLTAKRSFAYPAYYIFFDQFNSPAYEIVFSIHCCYTFVSASISNATCNLLIVLITHACGQLEIVMEWLNNLHTFQEDKDLTVRYSNIIEQHVRAIRFIARIEKLFQFICFLETLGCTLIICLVGYYILLDWNLHDTGGMTTYLMLLVSFICDIFLYCYVCELLMEKCKLVNESTYLSQWYGLPKKFSRGLVLTMVMSQNSNPIKAGKLIPITINTFGSVMRTSVVYLNLLRTFMD